MNSKLITNPKTSNETSRAWMLSLSLGDKNTAANLYMPFIKGGGVFVPSDKDYNLGDPVFILLSVGEEAKKFPINGKVVWICGANARGEKTQGIGIQFPKDDSGEGARLAIEAMIGKMQTTLKRTATL